MNLPNWLARLVPARIARRRFDGAVYNRLTAGWQAEARSINADLRGDLDALRSRSRELVKNEPMARKFLALVEANIVGPEGFRLQSLAADGDKPDTWARNAIEQGWDAWGKPGICEPTGRMSYTDLVRNCVRALARDGEVLLRVEEGADNGYGYRLQLLDIERLATWLNRAPSATDNAILMGVEIAASGAPVAYHLITHRYGDDASQRRTQRIPAAQIIHRFITDDPEQIRGVPWMHAAMIRMHHLKGYQEAAIIASRVGASKMGFFVNPEGTTSAVSDGEDSTGMPFSEVDPGQFGSLPEGWDFKPFNPDYPHQMYGDFIKAAKRDISTALNVAYHALANDLENVNFSSIRSGTLEERDHWMMRQSWVIDHLLDPIFERWLDNALLSSALLLPNGSALPAVKKQKFLAHKFLGRRWQWVDPLKDINAAIIARNNGLASPYVLAGQQGMDAEDIVDDIARFNAYATAAGVTIGTPAAAPADSEDDTGNGQGKPGANNDNPEDDAEDGTKALMLAATRALLREPAAPTAPHVTIHQGAVNVAPAEVRVDVPAGPAPVVHVAAPEVRIDVQPAEVRVEAVMPAAAAPVVNVNVEAVMPDTMRTEITALPARETQSRVERDGKGNISRTTQIETDA